MLFVFLAVFVLPAVIGCLLARAEHDSEAGQLRHRRTIVWTNHLVKEGGSCANAGRINTVVGLDY